MRQPMNTLTRLAPGRADAARGQHSYPFLHLLLAVFCLAMAILLLMGDSPGAALPCFMATAYLAVAAALRASRGGGLRPRRPKRRSTLQPRQAMPWRAFRSGQRVR